MKNDDVDFLNLPAVRKLHLIEATLGLIIQWVEPLKPLRILGLELSTISLETMVDDIRAWRVSLENEEETPDAS